MTSRHLYKRPIASHHQAGLEAGPLVKRAGPRVQRDLDKYPQIFKNSLGDLLPKR